MIRLENVLETSWRYLEDVLKTFLQEDLKMPWKRFARRLEDDLETYGQDQYSRCFKKGHPKQ